MLYILLFIFILIFIISIINDNPNTINQGVNLLFIGRSLERIGDHITNICEKIIYAVKGEMVEIG